MIAASKHLLSRLERIMDIKVGDLLECTATDSCAYTVGKRYSVVRANKGSQAISVETDGSTTWSFDVGDKQFYARNEHAGTFAMLEKVEFKPGDLVFEVDFEDGVALIELEDSELSETPFAGDFAYYTKQGKRHKNHALQSLYHATPRNRERLVAVFGEDEVPDLPPRGSDLTAKLLKKTNNAVLVKISALSDKDALENGRLAMATGMTGNSFYVITDQPVHSIRYAVAVDQNGNEITELPEPNNEKA